MFCCGYYIQYPHAAARGRRLFAQVIADCCAALKTMMEEFPNFRRSKTIHTQIVEINGLEEQGDKLYTDAMHTLYADASTPVDVMAWTKTAWKNAATNARMWPMLWSASS